MISDFVINVIVDPNRANRGINQVNAKLSETELRAKQAGVAISGIGSALSSAVALAGIGLGAAALLNMADTATNLTNRLRIVTGSAEELAEVQSKLLGISNDTRSSLEGTVTLYSRVAQSTKDLGLSQEQTLQLTENINKAFVISGASATEANAAIIQLSQGLASGVLRGDEFNSVMEQAPELANIMTKALGVTRGELREMAGQGKLTAQTVIDAMLGASESLDAGFGKTVPTLSQAFTVLQNNTISWLQSLDQATGITSFFAQLIMLLANNIGEIAAVMGPALFLYSFSKAVQLATTAWASLNAIILANPIVALITAITAVAVAVYSWREEILGVIIAFTDWLGITDTITQAFQTMYDVLKIFYDSVLAPLVDKALEAARALGLLSDATDEASSSAADAAGSFDSAGAAASGFGDLAESGTEKARAGASNAKASTDDLSSSLIYAGGVGSSAMDSIGSSADAAAASVDNLASSMEAAASASSNVTQTFDLSGRAPSGGTYKAPEGYELSSVQKIGAGSLGLGISYAPSAKTEELYAQYLDLKRSGDAAGAAKLLASNQALANRLWYGTSGGGWGTTGWGGGGAMYNTNMMSPADLMREAQKAATLASAQTTSNGGFIPTPKPGVGVGGSNVNITVITPDANSFARTQSQLKNKVRLSS